MLAVKYGNCDLRRRDFARSGWPRAKP